MLANQVTCGVEIGQSFVANEGRGSAASRSDFASFAVEARRKLHPRGVVEEVVAERIVQAAWRLEQICGTGKDLGLEAIRAERSLLRMLDAYDALRDLRSETPYSWVPPFDSETASGPFEPLTAHAKTFTGHAQDDSSETSDPDGEETEFGHPWRDRLEFDADVSDHSPVVKGTWVTATHVVSLVIDGWSWDQILRSHPELTETDIRACLDYTIEEEQAGELYD